MTDDGRSADVAAAAAAAKRRRLEIKSTAAAAGTEIVPGGLGRGRTWSGVFETAAARPSDLLGHILHFLTTVEQLRLSRTQTSPHLTQLAVRALDRPRKRMRLIQEGKLFPLAKVPLTMQVGWAPGELEAAVDLAMSQPDALRWMIEHADTTQRIQYADYQRHPTVQLGIDRREPRSTTVSTSSYVSWPLRTLLRVLLVRPAALWAFDGKEIHAIEQYLGSAESKTLPQKQPPVPLGGETKDSKESASLGAMARIRILFAMWRAVVEHADIGAMRADARQFLAQVHHKSPAVFAALALNARLEPVVQWLVETNDVKMCERLVDASREAYAPDGSYRRLITSYVHCRTVFETTRPLHASETDADKERRDAEYYAISALVLAEATFTDTWRDLMQATWANLVESRRTAVEIKHIVNAAIAYRRRRQPSARVFINPLGLVVHAFSKDGNRSKCSRVLQQVRAHCEQGGSLEMRVDRLWQWYALGDNTDRFLMMVRWMFKGSEPDDEVIMCPTDIPQTTDAAARAELDADRASASSAFPPWMTERLSSETRSQILGAETVEDMRFTLDVLNIASANMINLALHREDIEWKTKEVKSLAAAVVAMIKDDVVFPVRGVQVLRRFLGVADQSILDMRGRANLLVVRDIVQTFTDDSIARLSSKNADRILALRKAFA